MTVGRMILVCDADGGCLTRDGSVQPKGTAFERVTTDLDGSSYPAGPGMVLIPDDNQPLYVQNSGPAMAPPTEDLKTFINDADAIAKGLPYGKYYSLETGYVVQLKRPT